MNRADILMCWAAAALFGASAGLFWVEAASGPAPVPVTDLQMNLNLPSVVSAGAIGVSGTTSIVGGPSPATLEMVFVGAEGQRSEPLRLHTILKRDGTWSFNCPYVPLNGTGTGQVEATLAAGGKTVQKTFSLTITGGDFDVSVAAAPRTWMYENQGTQTANRHALTFTASITNDESGSTSYEYGWQALPHPKTDKSLVLLSGGGINDSTATYAAPQTPAASSEAYAVACEVIGKNSMGSDTGNALGAGSATVRSLGDATGDGKVDGGDLARWQQNYDPLGTKGATPEKGDWNGDGKIDGADLALWQQHYAPLGLPTP